MFSFKTCFILILTLFQISSQGSLFFSFFFFFEFSFWFLSSFTSIAKFFTFFVFCVSSSNFLPFFHKSSIWTINPFIFFLPLPTLFLFILFSFFSLFIFSSVFINFCFLFFPPLSNNSVNFSMSDTDTSSISVIPKLLMISVSRP